MFTKLQHSPEISKEKAINSPNYLKCNAEVKTDTFNGASLSLQDNVGMQDFSKGISRVLQPLSILLFLLCVSLMPVQLASAQEVIDENSPRGAVVDESVIQSTIYVDGATGNDETGNPYKTIKAGLAAANANISGNIPTKLIIKSGVYREGELETVKTGPLLVVEGEEKGQVIISGSDVMGAESWTDEGNGVYSIPWDKDWYFHDGDWGQFGPRKLLGQRKEMVFVNGELLKPTMIEDWTYTFFNGYGSGKGSWVYNSYLGTSVLTDGSFGVSDKSYGEKLGKLYIKLPAGTTLATAKIEVATRFKGFRVRKSNTVVRNLVVEHFANKGDRSEGEYAFFVGMENYFEWLEVHAIRHSIIEDCEFRWNSGSGYGTIGNINVTMRRLYAHHNGGNGGGSAYIVTSLWDDIETTKNNWRVSDLGGRDDWYVAGFKMGWCAKYSTIRNFKTYDNKGVGLWTDGNSYYLNFINVDAQRNKGGLSVEIASGPTVVENSNLSNNKEEGLLIFESRNTTVRNTTMENNELYQLKIAMNDGPRINDYPEEFKGGTSIKNEEGKVVHETKGIFSYNNIIKTNKGESSYLVYPDLQYSYQESTYQNFLNKEYKADSNSYYNPDNANVFFLTKLQKENILSWKERLKAANTQHSEDQEAHSIWDGYLPITPAPARLVKATPSAETSIQVSWSDVSDNETGFIIQRKTGSFSFRTIDTVGTDISSFTDTGLSSDSVYIYRVYSFNNDGLASTPSGETAGMVAGHSLPEGWSTADVGEPIGVGSSFYKDGQFIVNGSGSDIWFTNDGFHFAYQTLTGDGEIVAKLSSMGNTHQWSKMGLMFRNSLADSAKNVTLRYENSGNIRLSYRAMDGGVNEGKGSGSHSLPKWGKLQRKGNTFIAYLSDDGTNWSLLDSVKLNMDNTMLVGLAVTARNDGYINTARFDNVSIIAPPPSKPIAPSNFTATYLIMENKVDISWVDNSSNDEGLVLERAVLGGEFTVLDSLAIGTTAYVDATIALEQTYVYRLSAYNSLGLSPYAMDTASTTLIGDHVLLTTAAAKEIQRVKSSNQLTVADRNEFFKVGRVTGGTVGVAVYPFQLPEISGNQVISYANFKVNIDEVTSDNTVVVDLYGLPFNTADSVLASYYYDGVFTPDSSGIGTLIQSAFAKGGSVNLGQRLEATNNGQVNLASYINAQYAKGAKGGDWIFIRLNGDKDQDKNSISFDHAADADGVQPHLTISIAEKAAPAAPTNLVATSVSPTAIRINWRDRAFNEFGYVIERRSGTGNFELLDSLGAGVISYLDTTVSYGVTYQYRLFGYNDLGQGAYSDTLTTTSSLKTTLSAIHDGGIMEEYAYATVGTSTGISTFKQNGGNTRMAYVKFNLAEVNLDKVDSVVFKVRATEIYENPPIRVGGYRDGLPQENWLEENLSWASRFGVDTDGNFIAEEVDPIGGTPTHGAQMSKKDSTYTLSSAELVAFVKSQTSADQSVTFMFAADFGLVTFASKENTLFGGPTLQIFYKEPSSPTPAVVLPLTLTSVCSNDPTVNRRWRIRNENSFAVAVNWTVYGTNQAGTLMAPAGDSYFLTNTVANSANTTIISWVDQAGITQQNTKASSGASCSAKAAGAEAGDVAELELAIEAAPNPAVSYFTVTIPATTEKQAQVLVTNLQGQPVYKAGHALQEGVNRITISTNGMGEGVKVLRVIVGNKPATPIKVLVIR